MVYGQYLYSMKLGPLHLLIFLASCTSSHTEIHGDADPMPETFLLVLRNVQDAGSLQAGCMKECCRDLWTRPDSSRMVSSLALTHTPEEAAWFFDATPDFSKQWALAQSQVLFKVNPSAIFLTHGHIGHYTGLMYMGKEAKNSKNVPVYAFPRMTDFLQKNAPWEALINNRNVQLNTLNESSSVSLSDYISVRSVLVPHRDEYSETAGFIIQGPTNSALFIPDIDKWERGEINIDSLISVVDYAFIDGTFYDGNELPNRDIKTIPHPFISESMERFKGMSPELRDRIYFIHLNHTNPALDPESSASTEIEKAGFHVARTGMKVGM